jgi:hypothetical protein
MLETDPSSAQNRSEGAQNAPKSVKFPVANCHSRSKSPTLRNRRERNGVSPRCSRRQHETKSERNRAKATLHVLFHVYPGIRSGNERFRRVAVLGTFRNTRVVTAAPTARLPSVIGKGWDSVDQGFALLRGLGGHLPGVLAFF